MSRLSTQLLVIGAGATGLGIAWDACLRGIKTVLVDKNDIGEGTSGRYHGLLHSGGRYALNDPASAKDCAVENQILRKIAAPAIEDTGGYFVSTPTDPLDYPDAWRRACLEADINCEEISSAELLHEEPLLNPRISRAFKVSDASLDSFDLLHLLMTGIQQAGGKILRRHALTGLSIIRDRVQRGTMINLRTHEKLTIDAEFVINAGGPWAGEVAQLANISIPLTLGKGAMLAMSSRLTHAVINRCKPPSDGDIIVPVGTVCVLGTTDVLVSSPNDLRIESWEVDTLLDEADVLIPGINQHRPLRAWVGIRPLFKHNDAVSPHDRSITRAHVILDHRERDGIDNFLSVFGGKLTTFRLMAEEATNIVATRLRTDKPSSTSTARLPSKKPGTKYYLTDRLNAISVDRAGDQDMLICECELVTATRFETALRSEKAPLLDDLRRDLRLGMGPCQAAFCGFRAAGYAETVGSLPGDFLSAFTAERWKGVRSLVWGASLRQIELMRRINHELLHLREETG